MIELPNNREAAIERLLSATHLSREQIEEMSNDEIRETIASLRHL